MKRHCSFSFTEFSSTRGFIFKSIFRAGYSLQISASVTPWRLLATQPEWVNMLTKLERVTRLSRKLDPDRFSVCIFAHTFETILGPYSAHFVATKGRIEGKRAVRIDSDS